MQLKQKEPERMLQMIVEAFQVEMPPHDPNAQEKEKEILFEYADARTPNPSLVFEMRDYGNLYTARIWLSFGRDKGILRGDLDTISLELSRGRITVYEPDTGDQINTFVRAARNDMENTFDPVRFAEQIAKSLVLFFTHQHPPALPEFSPWIKHR